VLNDVQKERAENCRCSAASNWQRLTDWNICHMAKNSNIYTWSGKMWQVKSRRAYLNVECNVHIKNHAAQKGKTWESLKYVYNAKITI